MVYNQIYYVPSHKNWFIVACLLARQDLMTKQPTPIKEAMSIKQSNQRRVCFNPPDDHASSYDQASYVHQQSL